MALSFLSAECPENAVEIFERRGMDLLMPRLKAEKAKLNQAVSGRSKHSTARQKKQFRQALEVEMQTVAPGGIPQKSTERRLRRPGRHRTKNSSMSHMSATDVLSL